METPFHTTPVPAGGAIPPGGEAPRSRLITLADRFDRSVSLLLQGVLLLTGTAMMAVLTANIIARYVLSTGGFDWSEEVPQQIFPWFIMAGVALAVQHGGHIAVEWLLGRLGREGKRFLLLLGHGLVFAAYVALCWQALAVAEIVSIEHSPVLGLPGSIGYWSVAAGCALLALGTLTIGLRIALIGPEALPQPAPEEIPT